MLALYHYVRSSRFRAQPDNIAGRRASGNTTDVEEATDYIAHSDRATNSIPLLRMGDSGTDERAFKKIEQTLSAPTLLKSYSRPSC